MAIVGIAFLIAAIIVSIPKKESIPRPYLYEFDGLEWDINFHFTTDEVFAASNKIDVTATATVNDTSRIYPEAQIYFLDSENVPPYIEDGYTYLGIMPLRYENGAYVGETSILYRKDGQKCFAVISVPFTERTRTPTQCPEKLEPILDIKPLEVKKQLDNDRFQNAIQLLGIGGIAIGAIIGYLTIDSKKKAKSGRSTTSVNSTKKKRSGR